MTIIINSFVTVDTEDVVLIRVYKAIEAVKKHIADLESMPYESVPHWDYHELSELMDATYYDDAYKPYAELIQHYYWLEDEVSHEAYQRHVMADFRAYEAKHVKDGVFYGTEDEYSFYSDWYKDVYRHRPHHIRRA